MKYHELLNRCQDGSSPKLLYYLYYIKSDSIYWITRFSEQMTAPLNYLNILNLIQFIELLDLLNKSGVTGLVP